MHIVNNNKMNGHIIRIIPNYKNIYRLSYFYMMYIYIDKYTNRKETNIQ